MPEYSAGTAGIGYDPREPVRAVVAGPCRWSRTDAGERHGGGGAGP